MKIVSFSVKNFRSITAARSLKLYGTTVLIGPNNEGKSNLVKALATALNTLSTHRWATSQGRYVLHGNLRTRLVHETFRISASPSVPLKQNSFVLPTAVFDWDEDYPISLQDKPKAATEFWVEFELDEPEIVSFRQKIGSSLNGNLPFHISITNHNQCTIKVKKPGRGQQALTAKSDRIAQFIAERLDFEHIPAIRTSGTATNILSELVADRLRSVENTDEYKKALQLLKKVQQPILDELAKSIEPTIKKFLPTLKQVEFRVQDRSRALRSTSLIVNDGTPTDLSAKGDGVQSLATLALMRHISEAKAGKKHVVIAIEEPESHLHPAAIHAIHAVIKDMSSKQQVVITTHSSAFVQRENIAANIIVDRGEATPAKAISQIRESLGVRASDNLLHASLVFLLEGASDKRALTAIMSARSSKVKQAIYDGILALEEMHGATNIVYKISSYRDALCNVICLLDDDSEGRSSYQKAIRSGLVSEGDLTLTRVLNQPESEFEDLLDPELYKQAIYDRFRVSLDNPKFRGRGKWSERVKAVFSVSGKLWDAKVEEKIKEVVADCVEEHPMKAVSPHRAELIKNLIAEIEGRLGEIRQ